MKELHPTAELITIPRNTLNKDRTPLTKYFQSSFQSRDSKKHLDRYIYDRCLYTRVLQQKKPVNATMLGTNSGIYDDTIAFTVDVLGKVVAS